MINKNLVRAKKVHPSIIKEYSLTKIPQLEPETFLPPVSSSVDEVYYLIIEGCTFFARTRFLFIIIDNFVESFF